MNLIVKFNRQTGLLLCRWARKKYHSRLTIKSGQHLTIKSDDQILTIKFAGQHSEHALILVDIQLVNYVNVKDLKAMHYELNPKHKLPWQAGRKGALCPKWSHDQALSLLKQSLPALKGNRRYATINGVAFCAQEHRPGVWHGYPIGWDAVPTKISKQWVKDGKVTRKQIRDSRNEARQGNDE